MAGPVSNPSLAGPLRSSVWKIAWPAIAFQLLVFLNNFVDYQWVKELGEEAAAGQGAAWTTFWMLASLGQIFSTGATAVVARRVGEQRHDAARHAATHGMRGALLVPHQNKLKIVVIHCIEQREDGASRIAEYVLHLLFFQRFQQY